MKDDKLKLKRTTRSPKLPPAKVQAYANNNGLKPTSPGAKQSTYESDSSYRAHQEMLLDNTAESRDGPRTRQILKESIHNMLSTESAQSEDSVERYFSLSAKFQKKAVRQARTARRNIRG